MFVEVIPEIDLTENVAPTVTDQYKENVEPTETENVAPTETEQHAGAKNTPQQPEPNDESAGNLLICHFQISK